MFLEGGPLKVAITGIDGSGKSTTLGMVIDDLKTNNRIAKATNRPVYSVINGQKEYHYRALIGFIDKLHGLADKSQNPNFVCAVNAAHVMLQGRLIEPTLIHRVQPTLVLGARDLLVDPAVYAICYSPTLAHKPMSSRVDFLKRLTGAPYRDVIFFLTVPPDEAVMRIEGRMKSESESTDPIERPKWRHMHENPQQLDLLQKEYLDALVEIQKRAGTEVIPVNTSGVSQTNVTSLIVNKIRQRQQIPLARQLNPIHPLSAI